MPVFSVGQRHTTLQPFIRVDGLAPGRHEFELVVQDDQGNFSKPDRIAISVVRPRDPRPLPPRPTLVGGRIVATGPTTIVRTSTPVGGTIAPVTLLGPRRPQ